MVHVQIIVGSTRDGRAAEQVMRWIHERAGSRPDLRVTLVDLRDWPLPMFAETRESVGDFSDPTYSDPIVKRWNALLKQADAYIFITPEYNHSFSGVLKNAIDNVFASFAMRNKPAGLVGYSGGAVGGARAVEHLALVLVEAEVVPLRNTVLVSGVGTAFDAAGEPVSAASDAALTVMLDDLTWWGSLLRSGRAAGELPPGAYRFRSLVAAAG